MKTRCLALVAGVVLLSTGHALVDGSNTEVPAALRLRDYLIESKYPPENRLLSSADESLDKIPLIPGEALQSAKILGFSGDRLSQGSLLVGFTVQVQQAGTYSFRTYLQSDTGKPLVHVILTQKLLPGKRTLNFLFYGKAVRDAGHSGHFTLPGIVGERLPDNHAESGRLKTLQLLYRTKHYHAGGFTTNDWDSPQKRARIRELQQEINAAKR